MRFVTINHEDPQHLLIYNMLKCLTKRETSIIVYHYGLFGVEQCTLYKVAKMLNMTWHRTKVIEKKALDKLRTCKDVYRVKHEPLLGALVGYCDCGCIYRKRRRHWHMGWAFVCNDCFEQRIRNDGK